MRRTFKDKNCNGNEKVGTTVAGEQVRRVKTPRRPKNCSSAQRELIVCARGAN
jgi:hypothetical protein